MRGSPAMTITPLSRAARRGVRAMRWRRYRPGQSVKTRAARFDQSAAQTDRQRMGPQTLRLRERLGGRPVGDKARRRIGDHGGSFYEVLDRKGIGKSGRAARGQRVIGACHVIAERLTELQGPTKMAPAFSIEPSSENASAQCSSRCSGAIVLTASSAAAISGATTTTPWLSSDSRVICARGLEASKKPMRSWTRSANASSQVTR